MKTYIAVIFLISLLTASAQPYIKVAPSAPGAASSTLLNGLQFYYSLSDLTDATGGSSLVNNNSVTFVAGEVGNAANFVAASSQYLSHADGAQFQRGTGDFTMACWFNSTYTAGTESLCAYGQEGNAGYSLAIAFGGVSADVASGFVDKNIGSSSNSLCNGAWHSAVLTATQSGVATLYIDGVSVGTPVSLSGLGSVNNSIGFQIGAENTTRYLTGIVDEVGGWNRVLTSTEIANYNLGIAYPFTGH